MANTQKKLDILKDSALRRVRREPGLCSYFVAYVCAVLLRAVYPAGGGWLSAAGAWCWSVPALGYSQWRPFPCAQKYLALRTRLCHAADRTTVRRGAGCLSIVRAVATFCPGRRRGGRLGGWGCPVALILRVRSSSLGGITGDRPGGCCKKRILYMLAALCVLPVEWGFL